MKKFVSIKEVDNMDKLVKILRELGTINEQQAEQALADKAEYEKGKLTSRAEGKMKSTEEFYKKIFNNEIVSLFNATPVYMGVYNKGYFNGKKYIVFSNELDLFYESDIVENSTRDKIWNHCREATAETLQCVLEVRYRVPLDLLRIVNKSFAVPVKNDEAYVDVKYTVRDYEGDYEDHWTTIKLTGKDLGHIFAV